MATKQENTVLLERSKTKPPRLYKVMLLNDDYTPMEFVVEILKQIFHKAHAEATRIMLHVHQNGMGVAGRSPADGGATHGSPAEAHAPRHEYPAKSGMGEAGVRPGRRDGYN